MRFLSHVNRRNEIEAMGMTEMVEGRRARGRIREKNMDAATRAVGGRLRLAELLQITRLSSGAPWLQKSKWILYLDDDDDDEMMIIRIHYLRIVSTLKALTERRKYMINVSESEHRPGNEELLLSPTNT
ncbi:hypothetical protein SK128_010688 [Halocaridina rubra]|uniref:Uncharacterized protein n=1 Tax=Halocaridina rubra TaxID=373956 RepID=A0AAN8XCY5_HALRR